ncbi:Hypothetical predicted protein [Mytilus galloprovincialis]|uniref:CCHC-type domain-containing protein n=1 Tax=Mytilus galloprovincialis TaxID=29158 RepID=A0A8B6G8M4_MYTGA|nr:Hypothetical predicted protein [Mytilus galloprovincialis]
MEYSFRPQWRPWNIQSGYSPACGRCGKFHKHYICNSFNQRCYSCGKFGHYSSKCFSKVTKDSKSKSVSVKSRKQKERDTARINSYIQCKNIIRALPFSGMRNSPFIQYLDISNVLKTELKSVKQKMIKEKNTNLEQQKCIEALKIQLKIQQIIETERDQFKQDLENLRQQKEESASRINIEEYVNQIQELKDQVSEKDGTVKMVQDLYYLRSTEFTDEIQSLKNEKQALEREKADLCSKVNFQADSISQLTFQLQDLNHELHLVSCQNQQRPNHNRHYNNRRGGRYR